MNLSLVEFLGHASANSPLVLTTLLTIGVILINGWTDAPNAIATCVSTRSLTIGKAIILASVSNFLGVLMVTLINAKVAETIFRMVDFSGDRQASLIAFTTSLAAILIWSLAAWRFGIPTSEGHALIAGLTGSAIALQGGLSGINGSEWLKVIYGIFLSIFIGFAGGFLIARILGRLFKNVMRQKTTVLFKRAQIGASAGMAFMHGAQDGQKFIGIFLLGLFLAEGAGAPTDASVPLWVVFFLSVLMAIGTAIGGQRIIKKVGLQMVRLEPYQGFSADAAASLGLLASSAPGFPVSTTHTKTTAILGVGVAKRASSVKWGIVWDIAMTWLLTFPGCGLLGWLLTSLFLKLMQ